ncbi:MAG TPA: fasciclin domain-containing protein [Gaiellaceae bacterium]
MRRTLALFALAAVVIAAGASTATAQTRTDANIVQTAVAAEQFKTLTKLLSRAGLVSTLQQPGPYTVFAPTDAAFKKVPKSTLKMLLHNRAKLKAVLLYHVVSGNVTAADVVKLNSAKTLNGKSVRIRTAGTNVFVNSAKVTKPDVKASNGVIHVINRVLIPPTG